MPNDTNDIRDDLYPVFLAWGMPMETRESFIDEPTLWLTAGATLLLWTGLALLLTSA